MQAASTSWGRGSKCLPTCLPRQDLQTCPTHISLTQGFFINSTPKELASRTAYFSIAGQLGTMFAGAMMTAIGKNMSGHSGLKGWQWVFLIDGIITCPIALLGYLTFPDTPETTTARYLSERERALALSRVPKKVSYSNNIHPVSLFKRVLATPAL